MTLIGFSGAYQQSGNAVLLLCQVRFCMYVLNTNYRQLEWSTLFVLVCRAGSVYTTELRNAVPVIQRTANQNDERCSHNFFTFTVEIRSIQLGQSNVFL